METTDRVRPVIIADDDPMIRDVLRHKLEAINISVFVAANGEEAVEFASRMTAMLIILDLNMPRLNGLLACQQIRKTTNNAHTPIVILTADNRSDAEQAVTLVGATTYLTKPFRAAMLMQALAEFLPANRAMQDRIRRDAARAADIVQIKPRKHFGATTAGVKTQNSAVAGRSGF